LVRLPKFAPLFRYSLQIGDTVSAITGFALLLQTVASVLVSTVFGKGFGFATLSTNFVTRGIMGLHKKLPFLCQAGDDSQSLPGISMEFFKPKYSMGIGC
jgi:hypothetical protein